MLAKIVEISTLIVLSLCFLMGNLAVLEMPGTLENDCHDTFDKAINQ